MPKLIVLYPQPIDIPKAALSSPGMQEVGADATRISTGGAPLMLVRNEG